MQKVRQLLAPAEICLCAACALALFLAWSEPTHSQQTSADSEFLGAYRNAEPITQWPLKKLRREVPDLKGLQPSDDQSKLPPILAGVAQNLQAFWKNFADTTSVETIEESRRADESVYSGRAGAAVDFNALPTSTGSDKTRNQEQFRYLMLMDPANNSRLREYRTDVKGREQGAGASDSNFAKTSGFASMPQHFGGPQQALSDFRYLGSQAIGGESAEVVAFAQHVDPAAVRGRFVFGVTSVPLLVQGVAWIDPSGDHIVRMWTDLLAPQPNAGLKRVSTEVLFQEVKFPNNQAGLWLPREVNVTLDLDDFTFTNRHVYADYQLFSVSSGEKIQAPTTPPH
jgi:hypothetical protein